MTKKADIGSKRLIGLDPDSWVRWVTGIAGITATEIIDSDFQWLSRESDVLVRVYSPATEREFLVLNELQLRYNDRMPRRIRAYAALAEEKYELPTYPVLVNILPPSGDTVIVDRYESSCEGLIARQDYRVINLWEVDAMEVFDRPLPSLLPFVPILQGGGEETRVREALRRLRQDERLDELEPLLAFFATFVLESRIVQQIMRWDMAVLLESPWYNEILKEGEKRGRQEGLQEGRQEGLQEGRQEGLQEGRQEGLLSGIATVLEIKFGAEGLELLPEIEGIESVETLEAILSALKTANSIEQIRDIY
ncbi:Rpn family recombination-promoting nuclease/putative transposase [Pannus brasiliensis CCIBt3594]|uniref:Rpn family recombination-promoting nuclease/putative transposase n=1 Tax=Pannus brasiliensis CCIBt3594 TaxID=1427578 RepID=A0AAW9QMQ0_9CHRO